MSAIQKNLVEGGGLAEPGGATHLMPKSEVWKVAKGVAGEERRWEKCLSK
jgi:hypothetical protein